MLEGVTESFFGFSLVVQCVITALIALNEGELSQTRRFLAYGPFYFDSTYSTSVYSFDGTNIRRLCALTGIMSGSQSFLIQQ